nr:PAS domain S-box protein [Candidatus Kapabacteria bacterium]
MSISSNKIPLIYKPLILTVGDANHVVAEALSKEEYFNLSSENINEAILAIDNFLPDVIVLRGRENHSEIRSLLEVIIISAKLSNISVMILGRHNDLDELIFSSDIVFYLRENVQADLFRTKLNTRLQSKHQKDEISILKDKLKKSEIERDNSEHRLWRQNEFNNIISSISTDFINISISEIDNSVAQAFVLAAKFCEIDYCKMLTYTPDKQLILQYNWSKQGENDYFSDPKFVETQRSKFQFLTEKLKKRNFFFIGAKTKFPKEAESEINMFESSGIESMYILRLKSEGKTFGFLVFESINEKHTWSEETVSMMRIIGDIFVNALKRRIVETELVVSENKYRSIFENVALGMWICDTDGTILDCNQPLINLTNMTKEEIKNKNIQDIFGNDPHYHAFLKKLHDVGYSKDIEMMMTGNGSVDIPVGVTVSPFTHKNRSMFLFSAQNISERKKHESEIKENLKEKESLLQEVHHRVKNNMQVMTSLMNLQIRTLKNDEVINLFKESKNRIKAISMVHEKLYQTKHLSEINFNDFIKTLGSSLLNEFRNSSHKLRLISNSDNVTVDIATAIPCALILNELLSNSIEHGFTEDKSGTVEIEFCIDDNNTYILKYR